MRRGGAHHGRGTSKLRLGGPRLAIAKRAPPRATAPPRLGHRNRDATSFPNARHRDGQLRSDRQRSLDEERKLEDEPADTATETPPPFDLVTRRTAAHRNAVRRASVCGVFATARGHDLGDPRRQWISRTRIFFFSPLALRSVRRQLEENRNKGTRHCSPGIHMRSTMQAGSHARAPGLATDDIHFDSGQPP
ncbi:hypothetical protein S7711_10388 [Stachybotrys chartarum IBT 7711]|uniref:Uncharacterized protein n=1 Tax=Stachybotrys chartarum (strain CBS 109288 / IBT 7711) TaxID=1280523 RepID=A0A084B061_STACB|nr:hypothetical protein S7711_10388 [Stachybotrys chartarum IBT 7711]